jgi:hypothetical protein
MYGFTLWLLLTSAGYGAWQVAGLHSALRDSFWHSRQRLAETERLLGLPPRPFPPVPPGWTPLMRNGVMPPPAPPKR